MRRVAMGWFFCVSLSDILCCSSFHQYFTFICADDFDDDDDDGDGDNDNKNNKNKNKDWCIKSACF
jgi:hypothetical protein